MAPLSGELHTPPAGGEYYVFRDPVYNLVEITDEEEGRFLRGLLATREMQRLRLIKQNGFSALVYPGLEGSRFPHSLGSYHIARKIVRSLHERQPGHNEGFPKSFRLTDRDCRAFPIAALLHDIGHGPLSHVWEETMRRHPHFADHEEIGLKIVSSETSQVSKFLRNVDEKEYPHYAGIYDDVVAFLQRKHRLAYLNPLLSGNLDVDRLDFMARDTLSAGVTYGFHELEWLVRSFRFARLPSHHTGTGTSEWIIALDGRKGLSALTQFLRARENMYALVYHHKTTQAAFLLFRAIIHRASDALAAGALPPEVVEEAIYPWLSKEPFSLEQFIELDDTTVWHQIKAWSKQGADKILATLSRDLLERRLFKVLPLSVNGAATFCAIDEPENGNHFAAMIEMRGPVKSAEQAGGFSRKDASYFYSLHKTTFNSVGKTPEAALDTVWILRGGALGHTYTRLQDFWNQEVESANARHGTIETYLLGVHRYYLSDAVLIVDLLQVREANPMYATDLLDIADVKAPAPYKVVANLGKSGVWKSVFLGVLCEAGAHEDSIVALKCYKLDDKEAINAAIMRDVLKPNVLIKQRSNYLSHSRKIGEENGKIWLRETLWTGTLHDLIVHGGPSRNIIEVVEMGSQLFQGLAALHSHNLRHTDLKPDNCGFIQEERHKRRYLIGDFGCLSSEPTKVPEDLRLLGTQRTRAPEVWSDPNSISLKADVWALAACLYAVCMRKYPFLPYDLERGSTEERRAREEDIRAHLGGLSTAFQDDVQQNLPPVLTEVLLPCFAQSPSLRPESATVAGFFMGLRSSLSSQEDKSVLQGWQRSEDVLGQLRLTLGSPGEAGSASQRVAFLPELEWLINDATRFVPPSTLATLKSFAAER